MPPSGTGGSQPRSLLLRGEDLKDAEALLVAAQGKEPAPTPMQARYVQASRQGRLPTPARRGGDRPVRRALAAGLGVFAWQQRGEAVDQRAAAIEQRDLARSSALASASMSELGTDPELSLLLALEAAGIRRTPQVEEALREALKASHIGSVYEGHEADVNDLTYAPDGSWIASSSDDGTIQLWDPDSGEPRTTISFDDGSGGRIYSLEVDPGGETLASAGEAVDLTLWDPDSGDRILAIPLPGDGFVYTLSFSPDGERLASAGGDDVLIWDVASGERAGSIDVPGGAFGASYSPDGRLVATAGGDGVIRVWESEAGRQVSAFEGHQGLAFAAWFSPDGSRLVTAAEDRTARVWDVRTGEQVVVLSHVSLVSDVTFVRGSDYVATVDTEGVGRIWSLETGEPVSELLGHGAWMTYVDYDPVSDRLATASVDRTVRLWRPGSAVSELDVARPDLTWGARYSPDGAVIALSGGSGQGGQADQVELVDAETGAPVQTLTLPDEVPEVPDEVGTPWFTPDGASLAAAAVDRRPNTETGIAFGVVQFFDVETGEPGRRYALPFPALPYAVGFTSDGARFAVPSPDGVTRVWGTESGEVEAEFEGQDRGATDVPGGAAIYVAAFDPQDQFVATSDGNVAVLWDPEADEVVQSFEGHGDVVTGLDFSPDGGLLVTGSYDQTARIWDVASGQEVAVLAGHQNQVVSAEFSSMATSSSPPPVTGRSGSGIWKGPNCSATAPRSSSRTRRRSRRMGHKCWSRPRKASTSRRAAFRSSRICRGGHACSRVTSVLRSMTCSSWPNRASRASSHPKSARPTLVRLVTNVSSAMRGVSRTSAPTQISASCPCHRWRRARSREA